MQQAGLFVVLVPSVVLPDVLTEWPVVEALLSSGARATPLALRLVRGAYLALG